ncbi:MAG: HNH endonuclease [Halanaerobiales bacterium]|nr:HNH endonuclease [Halanaerobiales bacterium]
MRKRISQETREKMRQAKLGKSGNTLGKHWKIKNTLKMKGRTPWNKGISMSEESKQKMIAKRKGQPSSRKGIILSDELRQKLSDAHKGQVAWNKGKECPQISGENHWNWQGGKTTGTRKRVSTLKWKQLRVKIYKRDNWTCRFCFKHCYNDIQCHHIEPGNNEMDKLVTLCKSCHFKEHHKLRRQYLADITTKFNTLLSQLETHGINASS